MSRKLLAYVTVRDSALLSHTFGPDDDVPDWAAAQITNEAVWEGHADEAQQDDDDDEKPARRGRPRKTAE